MGWEVLESSDGRGAFFCNTTNEAFGPVASAEVLRAVGQAMHNNGRDVRECPPKELTITVHTFAQIGVDDA